MHRSMEDISQLLVNSELASTLKKKKNVATAVCYKKKMRIVRKVRGSKF